MVIGSVAGLAAFARRGAHAIGGRHPGFRAEDNPPRAVQVAWQVAVFLPQAYPFLVAAIPSFAYGAVLHVSFPLDGPVQIAAFLVWGAGGLLVMWSGRTLGRFMVVEIAISRDHELVTEGPYARIRHPTYTGAILMSFGVAFLFLNGALMAVAVLVVLLANYRASKEDRLLASDAGFGETYRAYAARAGRFLPRLRR